MCGGDGRACRLVRILPGVARIRVSTILFGALPLLNRFSTVEHDYSTKHYRERLKAQRKAPDVIWIISAPPVANYQLTLTIIIK